MAGYFIEKCRVQLGLQNLSLSNECHEAIWSYSWPGNIRELEHAIHRAAVLARAEAKNEFVVIQAAHFDSLLSGEPSVKDNEHLLQLSNERNIGLKEATEAFQREFIRKALNTNDQS